MRRYLVNRLLQIIPTVFLVAVIVFFIMHVVPGDPISLILMGAEGGSMTTERIEEMKELMGLNDPLPVQFFRFVFNACKGDLGNSIRLTEPVSKLITERLGYTMKLALVGLGFSIVLGLLFGVISALKQNTWIDIVITMLAYIGVSMPMFWLGLLLIYFFSFKLGWFEPAGGIGFKSLILPGFALGFSSAGTVSRITKANLVEIMNEDYIRTARSKGSVEQRVVLHHALKNTLIPVVTLVGLQFGGSLAGTVVTETVFSRQGIGRLLVMGIIWKDYPLVQGTVLVVALIFVLANLIVDISYAYIDPRVRYD